jgi:DHA2 family multidrug resistance protein-like MFS transporter
MSAVPQRRAGAGSATNEASREFGVAFGVAALGSVAATLFASRFDELLTSLSGVPDIETQSSLGGALTVAQDVPNGAGRTLSMGAREAFVDAMAVATTLGAVLALVGAVIVYRYLPRRDARVVEDLVIIPAVPGEA